MVHCLRQKQAAKGGARVDERLSRSIQYLKGVGEKRRDLFAGRGVKTVWDLLHLYPRAYQDWSRIIPIAAAPPGEVCCVRARVLSSPSERKVRPGLTLYTFAAADASAAMTVTLFNTRYTAQTIRRGEDYLFYGKVETQRGKPEMSSPSIAPAKGGERIRPVYPQTAGLSTAVIERAVDSALEVGLEAVPEELPPSVLARRHLLGVREAIAEIHRPQSPRSLEEARRRLVFEELFTLQLGLLRLKGRSRAATSVRVEPVDLPLLESLFPFALTGAQRRAVSDCLRDMRGPSPMNRLIQGDVGSGKTAVAAAVAFAVVRSGWQAAIMAPTDILARQHCATLSRLFSGKIKVGLLAGSLRAQEKRETLAALASGDLDLVVGTHALLSQPVAFRALGLVVTDEQHRFGVEQRAALGAKGEMPHRLVMSATPIPRTLALMIYGDLDVSVLDEMPPGRQPVKTYAVGPGMRERVLGFVERFLRQGRQAYIVCPLVGDGGSPKGELAAATAYADALRRGPLGAFRIGLLHGKMRGAEKERVMTAFAAHELDVLVSTTVIEVGVDVPNAAVMVVENAERFGLAQLHQLRGRVGRGKEASVCVLISAGGGEETRRRLRVMCRTNDGFEIAQEDLAIRGPGDFFGDRQHGLPPLAIADLNTDMHILTAAQEEALAVFRKDPQLSLPENAPLRRAVARLFASVGEEGLN